MVRLVFRPYTQIWRSICTSEPLRASTRVSSGFTLFRHSSPSFGSQQLCSYSNPSEDIRIGRWCTLKSSHLRSLSLRVWVWHPNTRIDVRLLGPCFKTGRLQPLRQHPSRSAVLGPGRLHCTEGYNTPGGATFPRPLSDHRNRCWPEHRRVHRGKPRMIDGAQVWLQALPFQQFHVLFNSLSKVLFIFRSLYLCAIGLWPIFSFRWNLPPILSCIPKQLDSSKELHMGEGSQSRTGFSPSMTSCSKELRPVPHPKHLLQITTRTLEARFQIWAVAASLAVTEAIPVGFFSSAYWYA